MSAFFVSTNVPIGAGSKVPHLSYVGDATIGEHANIGAATIFVNYDGVNKHHTTIGDAAFIGCDTNLVAPVTIGAGAYVAAGSAITKDVPPGALGVTRAVQRNIAGWVLRRRAGTRSAQVAAEVAALPAADNPTADNPTAGNPTAAAHDASTVATSPGSEGDTRA
jgi:bifunctional UDP-N-acetylglucosamine pyrophosphorylase/glucosamine-1-phosphate N-acetyltransferase